jgi:hypothetical protein
MFYGFDAAFVGDTGPDSLGALPIHLFFPLGAGTGETLIRGCRGLRFWQVIPDARLGKLFDDTTAFQNTVGAPAGYFAFLVLERVFNEVGVRLDAETGHPYEWKVRGTHPIMKHIFAVHGWASDSTGLQAKTVPWPEFALYFCYMIRDWVPPMGLHVRSGATDLMERFLTKLNGPVPSKHWDFVFWVAVYYSQLGDNDEFFRQMRDLHDRLVAGAPPE